MSVKFEDYGLDNAKVFNAKAVKDILQPYEDDDIDSFYEKILELKDIEFAQELIELRDCFNVQLFRTIEEIKLYDITGKYYDLRQKINKVIMIKNMFNDYKKHWMSVKTIADSMYERNKDATIVSEDMKVYKNKDEKLSATNRKLDKLVKVITYIEIVLLKLKQFEAEIREAQEYLMDVKQDVSRIQSAISLALDTGEIPRVIRPRD
jgi:hypothetical protein